MKDLQNSEAGGEIDDQQLGLSQGGLGYHTEADGDPGRPSGSGGFHQVEAGGRPGSSPQQVLQTGEIRPEQSIVWPEAKVINKIKIN